MAVKRLLFYALLLFSYHIAAHVFSQGFRNDYGAVGLLVLTGETHLEDVPTSEVQPDAIFASLGEMGQQLCQL